MAPKRNALPDWLKTSFIDDEQRSLVDEVDKEAADKPRKARRPKRNDTEKQVDRCIQDNFRGWGQVEIDSTTAEGLTLRERLTRDKRRHREDPSFAMGGPYYKQLRMIYCSSDDPMKRLIVSDPTQTVCPKLVKSSAAAKAQVANRGPLLEWCQTAPPCNQREYVGLLRAALELRPSISSSQCALLVEIIKYICRRDLGAAFATETGVCTEHFDSALTQVFINMKREKLATRTFWDLYRVLARLALVTSDVEQVLAATGEWADVGEQLDRVVAGSSLGKTMFGFAIVSLLAETVGKIATKQLALIERQKLTVKTFADAKSSIKAEAGKLYNADLLNGKRVIRVSYRGLEVPVEATTMHGEITLRCAAYMKSTAITSKVLEPLFCEDLLMAIDSEQNGPPVEVDAALVKESAVARKVANELFQNESWNSGDYVRELLVQKAALLISMDPTFGIEISFFSAMSGPDGERHMESQILKCLPTRASPFHPRRGGREVEGPRREHTEPVCDEAGPRKLGVGPRACDKHGVGEAAEHRRAHRHPSRSRCPTGCPCSAGWWRRVRTRGRTTESCGAWKLWAACSKPCSCGSQKARSTTLSLCRRSTFSVG